MKLFSLLCVGLIVQIGFSQDKSLDRSTTYSIIYDDACSDVPSGQCRVQGIVLFGSDPVSNGLISTFDQLKQTYTDTTGYFGLMVTDTDSSIYFFQPWFGESIIPNYDFKSGHEVFIIFHAQNNWEFPDEDKPVIYLYSNEPLEVSLSLQFRGELTFSYPDYKNGWNVHLDENGIYDKGTQQTYPYLFWEGKDDKLRFEHDENSMDGFVLKTDTIVQFFERQLTLLGLNSTEKTDFITYWAPRIMESNYIILQFLVDDAYDQRIAGLEINPKPDHLRRIFIMYCSSDQQPTVRAIPQVFEPFERAGFTVVEWGGSQLK